MKQRGICFEEMIEAILSGKMVDVTDHPNQTKYPNQQLFIVDMDGYIYAVPFVYENRDTVFLKTIYPTRKLTRQYKQGDNNESSD